MILLLVNLFIISLYVCRNIFMHIYGKYGQDFLQLSRNVERCRQKISKVDCDIKFLLQCKRKKLTPVFAQPKISVKVDKHTRFKIATTIIEAELQNKHKKKRTLKIQNDELETNLFNKINILTKIALNHRIYNTLKGKKKKWTDFHQRKLEYLLQNQSPHTRISNYNRQTEKFIHNYSSYILNHEEKEALSYSLDTHIPSSLNTNQVKTEFEGFYQQVQKPDQSKDRQLEIN